MTEGPAMPAQARHAVLIGIPVFIMGATGIGLLALGDQRGSTALMIAGSVCFAIAFLVWMPVAARVTIWATPEVKAWNEAMRRGPTANKINTVMCLSMLVIGLVLLVLKPSTFVVLWVILVSGMLVVFVRRGWFSRR